MDGEVLIPLAGIGMIIAIVLGPVYLKSRERAAMQETVRHAIDKGQPLPPELIDAMTRDVAKKLSSRTKDLRLGVIWLAVGVGIAAFGLLTGASLHSDGWGNDFGNPLLGIAAIPSTIGLAFIVLSFFNPNKE